MADTQVALSSWALREVQIPVGRALMRGYLHVPAHPLGTVVVAHGTGGQGRAGQNRQLAEIFARASLGSLCLDGSADGRAPLPSLRSGRPAELGVLTERLEVAATWLERVDATRARPIGYLATGLAATAACVAAAAARGRISAVVACGGELDVSQLPRQYETIPTLLIVAGLDDRSFELSCDGYAALRCPRKLEIVPGATHLLDDPLALAAAAELAQDWFLRAMRPLGTRSSQGSGRYPILR